LSHLAVLDVGKTLAKLSLWSAEGELLDKRTRPNEQGKDEPFRALDVHGIGAWVIETLRAFASAGPIASIIPVAHGAAAALLRDDRLACPPMDYEQPIPAGLRVDYDRIRDPFQRTGSPALPDALNLGVQLYYLESLEPALKDTQILLWPQYWAWFLCGIAVSDPTSLGCHTDLWRPDAQGPSDLARRQGWANRLPGLRTPGEVLGPIRLEIAHPTGLAPETLVHCGIHDSNAALIAARGFPEIADAESTVVSTGTWFVAMRTPGSGERVDLARLPEGRDCLVNIDAFGRPVPSARFMGGREIETLTGIDTRRIDIAPEQPALLTSLPDVVKRRAAVLPTFAPGVGPFPHARGHLIDMAGDQAAKGAAVSLYAALVTDVSLDLIGTNKRILIEGRFAEAQVFVRGLATLRPDTKVYVANAHNDVSFGALRLVRPELQPQGSLERVSPLDLDLEPYRSWWREEANSLEMAA
jgi:sugar (pentulose or hexulose) kinase